MPITTEQKQINDCWLLNLTNISKNWVWIDKGHIYAIKDGKFLPINKQAYRDLITITTIKFTRDHIVAPTNLKQPCKK